MNHMNVHICGQPHGFGRALWETGVAYHGEWRSQLLQGHGTFFFNNGDRLYI